MNTPTPHQILSNPSDYADAPCVLQDAWEAAKLARGQSVNFDRLEAMYPRQIIRTGNPVRFGLAKAIPAILAATRGKQQATARVTHPLDGDAA